MAARASFLLRSGCVQEFNPRPNEMPMIVIGTATHKISIDHARSIDKNSPANFQIESALRYRRHPPPPHAVGISGNLHSMTNTANRFVLGKKMPRQINQILV